jgi:sterol desaturase/sphingolipid hydroxylase (fatty acid hydroxylase superfamily)
MSEFLDVLVKSYTANPLSWWTTGITMMGAVLLVICERIWPHTPHQKLFRPGFFNDFFWYTVVQSYVLGLIIFGVLNAFDAVAPFQRFTIIREWPLLGQVVFFVVLHDFYIYWFHRFQHHSRLFWRTHEAHHSTLDVDWLSGSRSHSLEILINQSVEFTPIILLASPEVALIKGCIDAVWGMYIHSNVDVRSGWLQFVINGPEMHRWHHATDDEAHNKNFSTKIAVWDWLFGTAFRPANRKPQGYGLGQPFPENYFVQHAYAFRPFGEDGDNDRGT